MFIFLLEYYLQYCTFSRMTTSSMLRGQPVASFQPGPPPTSYAGRSEVGLGMGIDGSVVLRRSCDETSEGEKKTGSSLVCLLT